MLTLIWWTSPLRIKVCRFGLEYDHDYGMNHRRGWTYLWRGSVIIQLEPSKWKVFKAAAAYHWFKLTHGEDE